MRSKRAPFLFIPLIFPIMNRILLLLLLVAFGGVSRLSAQNVTAAEYFVDTDPGVGNGTPISVMPGDTATGSFPLNVTGLTPGFHNLYIRGRDAAGQWGFTHRQNFYVNPPPVPAPPPLAESIAAAEYFVDTDPGVGNGTPISVAPGDTVTGSFPLNVTGLTPGFHNLYIRGRDAAGAWGFTHRQNFYVSPPPTPAPPPLAESIAAAEYFVDTDPGVGNGTPISVAPGDTVTGSFPLNVTGLTQGFHNLYIRGRNTAGAWGFTHRQNFYVNPPPTPAPPPQLSNIIAAEFFIDTDPGVGNGTPVPIPVPGDTVNGLNIPVTVTQCLNPGTYRLYLRGRDAAGQWGFYASTAVTIQDVEAEIASVVHQPVSNCSITDVEDFQITVNNTGANILPAGLIQVYIGVTGANTGTFGPFTNVHPVPVGGQGQITATGINLALAGTNTVTASFALCNDTPTGNSLSIEVVGVVNPRPVASIGGNQPFCVGNSTLLTASGGGTYAWSTGANTAAISVNAAGPYTVTVTNANNCTDTASVTAIQFLELALSLKVFLQGPYVAAAQLMHDSLRVNNLIPFTEPYTALTGFTHTGGGGGETTTPAVLAVTGANAIVDWVFLELRSAANPAVVLDTRSALVQRDGDVVEVDGSAPVSFALPADASYFPVVRHRNHLGVQLGEEVLYSECVVSQTDFRSLPPEGFYAFNGLNPAQRLISGAYVLWAGNGRTDPQLKYNGSNNDRNAILSVVGLATPNASIPGYRLQDYNLDGVVKYNGSANDRNVLLGNVGVLTPSAVLEDQVAR